ncbi:hypothetical protein IM25_00095 [Rhodococcus sp. p52]|uniref:hypothetical protein n=1 Tax=Rhodococcus sp. p52 TaxID=935199 RepID=UPI00051A3C62|nr:hypothetical protein [Rhodococcus sp. p52]AOD20232.1 hypothetical protein IM25_00095 [Rhodococcus sp. p52]
MSREADIRTSAAVAQFFRNSNRARTSEAVTPVVDAVSEPSGLRIDVTPPPAGFGPWQQCTYREWAAARRDGLPALQLEITNDDQFGSAYWTARRQAGS